MSSGICASCGDSVNGYCFNCMGYVDEGGVSFSPDSSLRDDDDFDDYIDCEPDFEEPEPDFEEPDFDEPDFDEPDFDGPDFDGPDF